MDWPNLARILAMVVLLAPLQAGAGGRDWSEEVRSMLVDGRIAEAKQVLAQVALESPETTRSGPYLLLTATVSALAEEWEKAEGAYRACLRLRPGDPALNAGLGLSLARQKKWREAAEAFTASLEREPGQARIWFLRSEAELFADLVPDSVASFQRAIELEPRNQEFYLDYAGFLMEGRAFEQAERVYRAGLREVPGCDELKFGLAVALQSQLKWKSAQGLFQEIARLNPTFPRIQLVLARSLLESGDWEGAERAFRKGLEVNSRDAETLLHFGILLNKQGRFEEAAEFLGECVSVDGANPQVRVERARSLLELDRLREAERELSEAIGLDPECKEAFFELARLHQLRGDTEKARQALKSYQAILARQEASRSPVMVLKP